MLVATSVHFLMQSRVGDPLILYSLWPTLLLLTASCAHLQKKGWQLWVWLFVIVAALSLYTPYMLFLIAILITTAIASRQGRGLIAEIGSPVVMLSGVIFCVLLVPLGWSIYNDPVSALTYLGSIDPPSVSLALERLREMWHTLVDIRINKEQPFTPVLSIPALILGLYGLWYTFKSAARSRYVTVLLWLLTSIAVFLSAREAPVAMLFVPVSLLIITGLYYFIRKWYEVFPRNPYARITALVPIALLLFVILQFNYNRYFYGLPHSDMVRAVYSQDISLVESQISQNSSLQNTVVVVPKNDTAFFKLLTKRFVDVDVRSSPTNESGRPLIVSEAQYRKLSDTGQATLAHKDTQLIVDERPSDDALRFRIYQ